MVTSEASRQEPTEKYTFVSVSELDTRHSGLRLSNPEVRAALARSIEQHGILQPLTVNQDVDGTLVVLDGFKRVRIFGESPDKKLPVRLVSLSKAQAIAVLLTSNRPHKGVSELEEAWVVHALVREHKLLQVDVATLLGRHKSWVCRRLQLLECLEPCVVDDMRLGLISATLARELIRLPRGNQAEVAEAVNKHGLTSRRARELVERLLDAKDEKGKLELLADPLRFLASPPTKSLSRDPRLSEAGDKVKRSLASLERESHLTQRVLRSTSSSPVASDIVVLHPDIEGVMGALRSVLDVIEEMKGSPDE